MVLESKPINLYIKIIRLIRFKFMATDPKSERQVNFSLLVKIFIPSQNIQHISECLKMPNGKVWKPINWYFAINKGIGSMEFFLLEESCQFYVLLCYIH